MKNNKRYYLLLLNLIFSTLVFSQPYLSWTPGSTAESFLYESKEFPEKSTPEWTGFFVNPENTECALNNGKLNLSTKAGSIYGYELKDPDFLPLDAFTLDIKSEILTNASSFDINIDLHSGKSVKLSFMQESIVDAKTNEVLANGSLDDEIHNYRIAVNGEDAALYKDTDFISSLNLQPDDIVKDGDFENISSEEASARWGHDGYTFIEVVSNEKHAGSKSMKWDNNWNGRFMGKIKVNPNITYHLSYWAKLETISAWGQTQMNGGVYMNGIQISTLPISGGWKKYTSEFTTSSTASEIDLYYHNGWDGDGRFFVYFDDIVLERTSTNSFIQIGNLYTAKDSKINIGNITFLNGTAHRPVLLVDLTQELSNAQTLCNNAERGSLEGQYPGYAIERFETCIQNIQVVIDNDLNPESMDEAYIVLKRAVELFNKSQIVNADITLDSIWISIDKAPLKRDQSAQLEIQGRLSDQTSADLSTAHIQYNSLNPDIANVDESGEVEGITLGEGKIEVIVILNDVTLKDTLNISIIEYVLADLQFYAYNSKIEAGEAVGTSFVATMSDHTTLPENEIPVVYRSLDATIADITETGTILAKSKGRAKLELSATIFDTTLKDTIEIIVFELESIEIIPEKTLFESSEKSTYTLSASFSDGSSLILDNTNSVIWSKNRDIIKVNDKGQLKADSPGTTVVELIVNRFPAIKKNSVTLTVKQQSNNLNMITKENIKLYPLPFENTLTIESESGISELEMFDLSGKKIIAQNLSGKISETIDTARIPSGIFLLRIKEANGNSRSLKIIKK